MVVWRCKQEMEGKPKEEAMGAFLEFVLSELGSILLVLMLMGCAIT